MRRIIRFCIVSFFCGWLWPGLVSGQTIDLSGRWTASFDGAVHTLSLPGTLDDAGLGTPNTLTPQLQKPQLSRLTRRHSFVGEVRYERTVDIPATMARQPLELRLERVMWRSRLLIDGHDVGQTQASLVAPHRYLIPDGLEAGQHRLTLVIDNRQQYDNSVDMLAHAYTNDTQIMWNGVLGDMTLRALPAVYINNVNVYPDVDHSKVRVVVDLNQPAAVDVRMSIGEQPAQTFRTNGQQTELWLDIPQPRLWSELQPALYRLRADIGSDVREVTFGMRQISTDGRRLLVNGQPVFLRGTLECCVFPLTGTPPTYERGWMKTIETARQWGLNHLRFHSWCPPEAAFRVADRLGMYLQVELPIWSLKVGKDSATSAFLYSEFRQIIDNYGNHPSLCIISCGNELQPDFDFLNRLTAYMRQQDARHLYATSSFTFEKGHGGHPEPQDQVFITQWTDNGWVRGQGIFDDHMPNFREDYHEALAGVSVPLIAHEIGQYSVYPRISEIEKYTGVLDPLNFKAIRQDLQQKGLIAKADLYTEASGRLAAILYKEEVERAMKTAGQSGIQLLGLQDFPGQGTALVGLLDAFWDSKGLVEPGRFREFCAPVVPLARYDKAVWDASETLTADIDVANFSGSVIDGKPLRWKLTDDLGHVYAEGTSPKTPIECGRNEGMLHVKAKLSDITTATKLQLIVSIEGTPYRNRWNLWVYPATPPSDDNRLLVTQSIDEALRALKKGRLVLFTPHMEQVNGLEGKFLPVFWSPVHFPKQAGTMGLLCHQDHPALAAFPTDMNSDWQWWRLVKRSRVVVLDSISPVEPIVESVDNFVHNRRLAQLFEARVGKGRLVFSAFDLPSLDDAPEARWLLYSLKHYMLSPDFQPRHAITEADLRSLVLSTSSETHTEATSIYE